MTTERDALLKVLPSSVADRLLRDMEAAEHPKGMSTHDGKLRVEAWLLRRIIKAITSPDNMIPPADDVTKDAERLAEIHKNYWKLEPFSMPTGAGDADVGWRVIEFHEAKPTERTVAEVFSDDPRKAIDSAIAAKNQPRPVKQSGG